MEITTRRREQEVWQACDDLWAMHGEIKSLTGDAIRDRLVNLGKSRGSPNEIYKYRKTWVLTRGLAHENLAHATEETDSIARAVRLVHESLQNEASDHLKVLQEDFDQALQEKNQEIEKAKVAVDQVLAVYR